MIAALLNGFLGTGLCWAIGSNYLNMSLPDILLSVLASNIAALVSLLTILKAERILFLKSWLNRSMKTWAFLATIYFLILLGVVPALRDSLTLGSMILPLILSTGFAMIVFGPIQDQLVRRQQRRSRSK